MARRTPSDSATVSLAAFRDRLGSSDPAGVRAVGGVLAASAVAALLLARIAVTVPFGWSPKGIQAALAIGSGAAVVVPAVVAVAAGTVADSEWTLVGLVAAGTFGLLAAVAPAATVAATGVLPVAAVLATAPALVGHGPSGPLSARRAARMAFAMLATGGIALSLGAATGALPTGLRATGTAVALLALVVAPAVVSVSLRALAVGLVAAITVAAAALLAPFAVGAVFLAVGAAVDPGIVLAAAGVGAAVAVAAEGLRRRRVTAVAAAILMLAAGIPATVPRALAVVLGAHLLLMVGSDSPRPDAGGAPA